MLRNPIPKDNLIDAKKKRILYISKFRVFKFAAFAHIVIQNKLELIFKFEVKFNINS